MHGKYIAYDRWGVKVFEGTYKNGYKDGVWKQFWDEKIELIRFETTYVAGSREGVYKAYHMNGKIYQEGFFKNDNEEGVWKTYSDFGKLRYEEEYEKGIRQKVTRFE